MVGLVGTRCRQERVCGVYGGYQVQTGAGMLLWI